MHGADFDRLAGAVGLAPAGPCVAEPHRVENGVDAITYPVTEQVLQELRLRAGMIEEAGAAKFAEHMRLLLLDHEMLLLWSAAEGAALRGAKRAPRQAHSQGASSRTRRIGGRRGSRRAEDRRVPVPLASCLTKRGF